MERLTDHENEHYNQPGCNSCSDYRWRSCKESGEIDDCIQRLTWLRLLDIEDILGDDYDLDRLREMVKADREGRVKILAPAMLATCGSCTSFRRTPGTASGICGKREQFKVFQKRPCCKMYEAMEDCK